MPIFENLSPSQFNVAGCLEYGSKEIKSSRLLSPAGGGGWGCVSLPGRPLCPVPPAVPALSAGFSPGAGAVASGFPCALWSALSSFQISYHSQAEPMESLWASSKFASLLHWGMHEVMWLNVCGSALSKQVKSLTVSLTSSTWGSFRFRTIRSRGFILVIQTWRSLWRLCNHRRIFAEDAVL